MVTEKVIKVPIYNYKLKVVIFDNIKEVRDAYPQVGNSALGATLEYEDHCIMLLPSNDLATIVHECEHAKNIIWNFIGHKAQENNDEVDAYLLTYIFTEVNKEMQKHTSN